MSSATQFDFNATLRATTGRASTRSARNDKKVPAIVYGAGKKPEAIVLEQREVLKALSFEAVFSHILNLSIDGKKQKVILKALARHPIKPQILHMDFFRIKAGEKITMNVPVHFLGGEECPGVAEGGVISHLMTEIEIVCLPEALPEYIEVDLSKLELDNSIHLSEVALPKGVELTIELTEENDPSIASVHRPRIEEEPEEEVTEEEGEAGEGEAEAATTEEGDKASAEGDERPKQEEGKPTPDTDKPEK